MNNYSRSGSPGRGWNDCALERNGIQLMRIFHNDQAGFKIKSEHASRIFFEHLLRDDPRKNFLSTILTYCKPAIILDKKTALSIVEDVKGRGLHIRGADHLVDVDGKLIIDMKEISDEWIKFTFHDYTDLFQTVREDNGKYTLVSRYAD